MKAILAGGVMLAVLVGGWFVASGGGDEAPRSQMADGTPEEAAAARQAAGSPGAASSATDTQRVQPSAPTGRPVEHAGGLAFILNSAQASIDLIDVATRQTIRRVPVLREPHHMALTPDHRSLVVGDTGANELLFFDPVSGELQRRMPVSDPYQLGYSPDGKWLVVNGLLRNQVDIYDAATMRLSIRVPIASMPSHENFSPDSSTVYVTLQSSNSVAAIQVASGKVLWKAVVGPVPAGVLWHRGKLLVGVMGADYVAVVDPATGKVERRVQTAKGAHVLFVPHDGRVIYVTNRVDGSIVVLDPNTLAEIRRFRIPGGPDDMDFAPDGKIWVTRRWEHSVAIVDPETGAFQTIETGRSPHGIWLNTHDALPTPVTVSAR